MKQEVLEWFLDREGEVFRKGEAVEELSEEVEMEEDRAWGLVNHLVSDIVDPVIQLMVGGERYVGVIEFEEHGYWYEYIHYSDLEGEMRRGVCVQCVKESERDHEVFHATQGLGNIDREADTAEIGSRLREHLGKNHGMEPRQVEIGAKLLSGTTISGNEAIHTGNDGPGSGVEASIIDGSGTQSFIGKSSAYQPVNTTLNSGTVVDSFTNTSVTSPYGTTVDSSGCIWYVERNNNNIVEADRTGSIVSSFSSPNSSPRGLGIDNSGCLWHTDDSSNPGSAYRIDQSGTTVSQWGTDDNNPVGISVENATGCVWYGDSGGSIFKADQSITTQSSIAAPSMTDATGLGVGEEGCIWYSVDGSSRHEIFKVDQAGNKDTGFTSPSTAPRGVDFDHPGLIWHADSDDQCIFRVGTGNSMFEFKEI